MSMTVRQLIAALRKRDQDAIVGWQSHDQSSDEIDGWVWSVTDGEPELCKSESKPKIVVLRP